MNKKRYLDVCLLVLIGCLGLVALLRVVAKPGEAIWLHSSIHTQRIIPGVRPFIDTTRNIHLFQSFSFDISNPASVAKSYDFVWGAQPDMVSAFRSANHNVFLSYYIPFERDYGTFTDERKHHDLHYWQSTHPDWVLYRCDRKTPAYEYHDPTIPLDVTNPAVLDWFVQTYAIPASQDGRYDAIAADNLDLDNYFGACGVYKQGHWVQLYSGQSNDPNWSRMIVHWSGTMQTRLHALSHPLALIGNLALGHYGYADPFVRQAVQNMDGVLDEAGFTLSANGYSTDTEWTNVVAFMKAVQAQGKPYFLVNQFRAKPVTQSDIQWALSSYLMGKDNLASIFISPYQDYGKVLLYKEYTAQIGTPIEDMRSDQHVFWRAYTNGLSIVNPSENTTFTVSLPAAKHYADVYGRSIHGTIILAPHSGIVLLRT